MTKKVVLVGAGHGHLEVARRGSELTRQGIDWTLIDPGNFWYSGRATAMLAGTIAPKQDQIDPMPLVARAGGSMVRGVVADIDRNARIVRLDNGVALGYDVLSLNVGSVVGADGFPVGDANVYPVKPLSAMWELTERIRTAERPLTVTVVGGGVTGCEVCACLAGLVRRQSLLHRLILVHGAGRIAPTLPPGAADRIDRHLRLLGVQIMKNNRAESFANGRLHLLSGAEMDTDCLVLATGLHANPVVQQIPRHGDAKSPSDGVRAFDTLQTIEDPHIFAIGDCASLEGYSLPRHGVFAVKSAPILVDNLIAACFNRGLKSYSPQKNYLSIINLGDDSAMALWGGFYWHGRLPMIWKEFLDRRFMQRYRCD